MDPSIKTLLVKTAEYVERTQPLLDQRNVERKDFVEKATKAASVLASRGVLGKNAVAGFVDKVAASPATVWDVVEKLATLVGVDTMGEVGREKVASETELQDPFVARYFGTNNSHASGMVD